MPGIGTGRLFTILTNVVKYLIKGIGSALPYWGAKAAAGVGVALVSHELFVEPMLNALKTHTLGVLPLAATVIHAAGFDVALSSIFAAYSVRMGWQFVIMKQAQSA